MVSTTISPYGKYTTSRSGGPFSYGELRDHPNTVPPFSYENFDHWDGIIARQFYNYDGKKHPYIPQNLAIVRNHLYNLVLPDDNLPTQAREDIIHQTARELAVGLYRGGNTFSNPFASWLGGRKLPFIGRMAPPVNLDAANDPVEGANYLYRHLAEQYHYEYPDGKGMAKFRLPSSLQPVMHAPRHLVTVEGEEESRLESDAVEHSHPYPAPRNSHQEAESSRDTYRHVEGEETEPKVSLTERLSELKDMKETVSREKREHDRITDELIV